MGIISKFKKTFTNSLSSKLISIFPQKKQKIDKISLKKLEKLLIGADLSNSISQDIIKKISKESNEISLDEIKISISEILLDKLKHINDDFYLSKDKLNILIFSGINGSGKTSSLAKIFYMFHKNYKVAIAACDTFRAAALEQLKISIDRSNSYKEILLYKASDKYKDPSSIAFHSISESLKNAVDILLIDTAGRLQNNSNLMSELQKMIKVVKKFEKDILLYNFIIIDSTIGQNSIKQIEIFKQMTDVNAMILTKMDSSSKAGAIFSLQKSLNIPIYFITYGEQLNNISKFKKEEFVQNLLSYNS
ncbi:MAG: signal recognition particle-docking protein FtsY [Rickettsia sp.]|nr:signal recognition particle-docking protein FtsY [Rickettsia sp.]